MKYYAVTEDPNELFHYGRLGMKWGQHIFGDKPKSPGYKRALGKLRASSKSAKSAIKKSATQHAVNKQKRQQNKYNQAVKKAQRNIELVENLHNLDQVRVNERGLDRDYWGAAKVARIHDKQNRKMDKINNKRMIKQAKAEVKYNKKELKMDKYMQLAREGKLKYGQLSDDQVQRLTNRLNMERNARQLGSAEKTWRQQKKEAFRQGKLQGITRGTAASMEEIARAGTIYGLSKFVNRNKLKALAKQEGKEERIKNRERNKKSHSDIKQDFKNEVFEAKVRDGQVRGTKHDAEDLKKIEADKREKLRIQNVQDRLANERDEGFDKLYIGEKGFKDQNEAVKAHKKALDNDVLQAKIQWGEASDQVKAARQAQTKFDKADANEQKRLMISYENEKKKQETENKKANALSLYREAMAIQQTNNVAMDRFHAKMNAYQNALKSNKKNVQPPRAPTIKPLPEIDAESLSILNSMGLSPYKNGGGKKNS